ncbi:MAG: YraN family protein [Mycobacteriales bacterium]
MRAKDAVGAYGEQVAARHLQDVGMRVLDRNWRCPEGEIDLVLADGEVVVFCEVKTRSSLDYGDPAEAVVGRKAARLRRLGLRWLAAQGDAWRPVRFDVVTVVRQRQGPASVRHLPGAF